IIFFFQAEDGIRDRNVTGVQTCALPICLELAEKLAPGHEVAVYTHDDTDHIHNHIVINSVNFETGKKYQAHGKEAIERARSLSDEVCKSHDLSVVKEHNASVRHTLAE